MIDTGGIGGRGDESDGSADDNITVTVPPAHAHQPHVPHGSHGSHAPHGPHGHHGPPGSGGAHAQPPHTRPPNMHPRYGTRPNTVQFLCMLRLCMHSLFCLLFFVHHCSILHAVLGVVLLIDLFSHFVLL